MNLKLPFKVIRQVQTFQYFGLRSQHFFLSHKHRRTGEQSVASYSFIDTLRKLSTELFFFIISITIMRDVKNVVRCHEAVIATNSWTMFMILGLL